ncbi:hypothetical protein M2145_002209 [Lachnospiraceae bacterium PF1-21]
MVGENLRDGYWEVAFEQWTERVIFSRLQRYPHVTEGQYRKRFPYWHECKEQSLNLGGTTDSIIRPKLF